MAPKARSERHRDAWMCVEKEHTIRGLVLRDKKGKERPYMAVYSVAKDVKAMNNLKSVEADQYFHSNKRLVSPKSLGLGARVSQRLGQLQHCRT